MGEGKGLFGLLAGSALCFLLLFAGFLFCGAFPALLQIPLAEVLFGRRWAPEEMPPSYGILPMLAGTCLVTGGAVALAAPMLAVLAGIPSVIYGFWGMLVLVPAIRECVGGNGNSLLAAILLLAFMLLPTIAEVSSSALAEVPQEWLLGARTLGASKIRAIWLVELPAAYEGLRTGILLAVSRAMGETMAVSMVAGNQPLLPRGFRSGIRTLTSGIAMEMGYAVGLHRQMLYVMGVVLLVLTALAGIIWRRRR